MNGTLWRRTTETLATLICILLCLYAPASWGESGNVTAEPTAEPTMEPTAESTAEPTAEPFITQIVESSPTAEETISAPVPSLSLEATPTPEASATPVTEDVAPICDIPGCTHLTVNENGETVAVCLLGTWMLAHAEAAAASGAETQGLQSVSLLEATADASLLGGDIVFSDFTAIGLNGLSQTTIASWAIGNVTDTRGTGEGWNVSLTLTPFQEWSGDGYVPSGDTLSTLSLTVTVRPEVNPADEFSSSAAPITTVENATALDTGTPIKLLTSGEGEGMGSFSVTDMTVSLSLPANVYAHTYKTDATVALITGP